MSKVEHFYYLLLSLFCVAVSFGGVYLGITNGKPIDGSRGGVIALAVSFATLFLVRDYGAVMQNLISKVLPEIRENLGANTTQISSKDEDVVRHEKEIRGLESEIKGIARRLSDDACGQKIQNRYLAFTSVIGTLVTGFGDMVVHAFCNC